MADKTKVASDPASKLKPHCGIIMPISEMLPNYPASHWKEVQRLIKEAAKEAGFTCEMVSDNGTDDIIHGNIINNIYKSDVIVCDVSGRNPNVMFELGMRLSTKLPTIIIFDRDGNYPFDINSIKYLDYRQDMRYYETQKFKDDLAIKIGEVHKAFNEEIYKPFLSYFKHIEVDFATLDTEKQDVKQFLESIDNRLSRIENNKPASNAPVIRKDDIHNMPLLKNRCLAFVKSLEIPEHEPIDALAVADEMEEIFPIYKNLRPLDIKVHVFNILLDSFPGRDIIFKDTAHRRDANGNLSTRKL
jgi:hypothetical protein